MPIPVDVVTGHWRLPSIGTRLKPRIAAANHERHPIGTQSFGLECVDKRKRYNTGVQIKRPGLFQIKYPNIHRLDLQGGQQFKTRSVSLGNE